MAYQYGTGMKLPLSTWKQPDMRIEMTRLNVGTNLHGLVGWDLLAKLLMPDAVDWCHAEQLLVMECMC